MKLNLHQEIAVLLDGEPEGLTVAEIAKFFPDRKYNTLSAAMSNLYAEGGYRREPVRGGPAFRYWSVPGAKPEAILRRRPHQPKQTEAGAHHECEQLREKVAELEEWKSEAIRRFPDLAVEPTVITAREIVAKRLRSNGDENGAKAVLCGQRDHTPIMQAAVDALEWAA